MDLYDDKAARSRSIMHRQKRLCNGEATGLQCTHYLEMVVPMDVPNSDHLHQGETYRYCTLVQIGTSPMDLGDGGSEMPSMCNRYRRSELLYDPAIEKYKPLTPEEIERLSASAPEANEENTKPGVHVGLNGEVYCGECGLILNFDETTCPECKKEHDDV